jgi:hypothetical protein
MKFLTGHQYQDIRDAVGQLCQNFPGEYWREPGRELAYLAAAKPCDIEDMSEHPALRRIEAETNGHSFMLAARVQQRKADVGYIRQAMHCGEIPEILKMTAG